MAEYLKHSVKLFLKLLLIAFFSAFLVISFRVIFSGLGGKVEKGYIAYGQKGDEPVKQLYQYMYSEGDDLKYSAYEQQGYKIEKSMLTEMTHGTKIACDITTAFFSIFMAFAVIYMPLFKEGTKDVNLVNFGHKQKDMLKGLKIGLIANIPFVLLYIAFFALHSGVLKGFNLTWYKFISGYLFVIYDLIFGASSVAGELSVSKLILAAAPLLFVPAAAAVSYVLGYKEFSLEEKLIYKNKKRKSK